MWTILINNMENGIANVTAQEASGFAFSSIIKIGDVNSFVTRAKLELVKHQELHKDDSSLKLQIENLLNL